MSSDMIMTVRGAVAASAIKPGGILVHQRVLQKETTVVDMDIAAEDLMELREHPAEKGNLVLSNETRAYRELERLSLVQSNCVVDIHGRDERDVVRLKRMSEQLDLHILASTSLDDTTTSTDVSALAHQLVLDLQYGMDNTTIQASVIYQRTSLSPANPTILRAIAQGYVKPPPSVIPKDFIPCSICRLEFEPVVGEYFTKFEFVYCSTKCLRRHRVAGFGPVDQLQ
ncbi:hypothetical protein DYB38_000948 [Aphanomyces astaci]|uniref:Vms1-associating treble clef domain-containing protein n=1 Tax=Aphanomyces astaci TaxID=112090 RepID=A0A397DBT2_APHAT|nr:hypothetical protein DYB38_000948 [Aphanomyces astaci]